MKTVVITGASRGIGRAIAEKFLGEGWAVIGTSKNGNGWEHEELSWVELDLADPESIERATTVFAHNGPVDILINNAGVWPDEEDVDHPAISVAILRRILEVNLIGTIDLTERMISTSLVKGGGHIILLGSGCGVITRNDIDDSVPSYRISKVGLSMYTRTLALRLEDSDIKVSILDPGWVRTDMGGREAPRSPEEPAQECFELAIGNVPTGRFWREGKERNW